MSKAEEPGVLGSAVFFDDDNNALVANTEERTGQVVDKKPVLPQSRVETQVRKSYRSHFVSSWVHYMDAERAEFTAGAKRTVAGFVGSVVMVMTFSVAFLLIFCRVESSLFGGNPVGHGDRVFKALSSLGDDEVLTKGIATVLTILLWVLIYLLDIRKWHIRQTKLKWIGRIIIALASVFTGVTVVFLTNQRLYAPYLVFNLLSIAIVGLSKRLFFPDVDKLYIISGLVVGCVISGILMLFLFLYDVFVDNHTFSRRTEIKYRDLLDCPETPGYSFVDLLNNQTLLEEFESSSLEFEPCDTAVLVWSSPLIYFFAMFALTGVLLVLHRAEKRRIKLRVVVGFEPIEQMFLAFMGISVVSLWISVAVANSSTTVNTSIFSVALVILISIFVVALAVFRVKYVYSQFKHSQIGSKIINFISNDWGKGLILLLTWPFLVIFLVADYLKQLIWRRSCIGSLFPSQDLSTIFTPPIHKRLNDALSWDFGSIILKAHMFGFVMFFFLVFISNFVILFFNAFRHALLNLSFAGTIFSLLAISLIFHVTPRFPVIPTYMFSGMTIPSAAEQSGGLSFIGGAIFAVIFCTAIRLVSRVVQHQFYGQVLAPKRLFLRKLAKVNDPEFRAMLKFIRSPDTPFYSKAIVLTGSPDWTTGVFLGLNGYELWKLSVFSSPIIFRIAPCIFLGSMAVKSGLNPDSSVFRFLNTVALLGTVTLLLIPNIQASVIRQRAVVMFETELLEDDLDEEVRKTEELEKTIEDKYNLVTSWVQIRKIYKIFHVLSLVALTLSLYSFQFIKSSLFVTFDITDSIDDKLNGHSLNIVREAGWGVLFLFFSSVFYFIIFTRIHKQKAKRLVMEREDSGQVQEMTL